MRIVNALLLVTVFLLGFFSLGRDSINDVQPASFLPADTLVYVDQKNGPESIERFRSSRLGRVLSTIDVPAVLREVEADPYYHDLFEQSSTALARLSDDPLIREVLGRRCTIALFGKRVWSANAVSVTDYLKKHLLLISRPQENVETLHALMAATFPETPLSTVSYGKYTIKRIQLSADQTASITYADGQLLVAFEERVLREALDLHDKKRNTLRLDSLFQGVVREMEGAERFFYISVEGLQLLAADIAGLVTAPIERRLLHQFSTIQGVTAVSYGEWHRKKLMKNRCVVSLNTKTMDEKMREMIGTQPSINDTLPYVTRDVLLYYWTNSLDLRLIWGMYLASAGTRSNEVLELEKRVQRLLGHDIKDVIAMINSNFGVMVRANNQDQFVPIPDFAILLKLNDPEGAGRALQRGLKEFAIKLQQGTYKDITYYSWGIDPKESLQPVYAIHRDYLILANTLDILKTILDTPLNNSRLIATKGFKELDPGFQTLNNSVCYIDQVRLLAHLQEFIGWAGTILAIQDRKAAEKSKALIDRLIDPLFMGLSMYEKTAIRTYVRDNRVYIDSQTRITQ